MSDLHPLLNALADGRHLTQEESSRAFQIMFSGGATPAQIAAMLMGLRINGETVEEMLGAVEVMRVKCAEVAAPQGTIDVCGTGGDKKGTLNISTAVAFVVAACGVPVAKHGNRAVSSHSGSADVLKALGVNFDVEKTVVEECLKEIGICFMLATRYHPSMRHISPIRQELGLRTIFNLLGPLANPARVKRQLLGVFSQDWTLPMAEVMKKLGTEKAWIVHGEDGMDEITTTGKTHVTALSKGHIQSFTINPEEFGIPLAEPQELQGRTATENAHAITRLLAGEGGPYRDIVMLNAAAALVVADRVGDITVGLQIAAEAIDSGAASDALAKLVMLTNA